MSILGKFNSFEIGEDNRISADDKEFLEKSQQYYEKALLYYSRISTLYQEEKESYSKDFLDNYNYSTFKVDDCDVYRKISGLQKEYISNIYSYFERTYKVNITRNKYDSFVADYEQISRYDVNKDRAAKLLVRQHYQPFVDDIVSQLGGLDFAGVATQQLKEKMKEGCYNQYRDKWNIEVKNNVIKYTDGYVSKDWYSNYKVHRDKFFEALPDVISMYFYGKVQKLIGCDYFYGYNIELEENQIGTWLKWSDGLKITAIKFYKNGRFDMKFATPEDARDFARTWCGYTLV